MENRTSGDVLGHAADVWGQRAMSSCPAATAMILPIANDLVLRIKAWVSLLIPSRHSLGETRIPRARVGLRELDGSGPQGRREWAFAPQPARVESKFIDDHVAGADRPGGVADRRDCELQR